MSRLTSIFNAFDARKEAERKRWERESDKRSAIIADVMRGVNLDPLPHLITDNLCDRPVRVVLALGGIADRWNRIRPWIECVDAFVKESALDPAVLTWADLCAAWSVGMALKRHDLLMQIRVRLENAGLMPHPPSGISDPTLAP